MLVVVAVVCRSEGSPFTLCTVRCQLESVSSSIRNNYELQNMKRTADNAYKQFNKGKRAFIIESPLRTWVFKKAFCGHVS